MIAVLQNIRSAFNVGTVLRTADAVGIKKVYLCGYTPAPVDNLSKAHKEIIKVSLGAESYVDWEKVSSTTALLKKLKKEGYKIVVVELAKNSQKYYKFKPKSLDKIVLVVGNEIRGVSKPVMDLADKIIEIPMLGKKESLNVGVAFAIVAYRLKFPE
ncbi:RNA methyltransferase [archaeon]|nr:RNA methyltransferase [archaeon]